MQFEFTVRFSSAAQVGAQRKYGMTQWSKDAAKRFFQKRLDENVAREIIGSQSSSVFGDIEAEVHDFNTDFKSKILAIDCPPGHTVCVVTRQQSKFSLAIGHDPISQEIRIEGGGGLDIPKKILYIRADLAKTKAYLADDNSHAVQIDGIITDSLNALLEI